MADVADRPAVERIFRQHRPDAVMHLAAETHVDRSIDRPDDFIHTNMVGTFTLLEAARGYWGQLEGEAKARFRFHHISTDEVFGSLGADGRFTEETPYRPNSPYSASKAGADHLVRAWHQTYGFPVVTTNCSNNYGPWQFPEKLIPLMILNALDGKKLPVYGTGANVRDWLYVGDHAAALALVLQRGRLGETYNIGGGEERSNIDIVQLLCAHAGRGAAAVAAPAARQADHLRHGPAGPRSALCDRRQQAQGRVRLEAERDAWRPDCARPCAGILDNRAWWEPIRSGLYRGERLGRAKPGRARP